MFILKSCTSNGNFRGGVTKLNKSKNKPKTSEGGCHA